MITFTYTCVNLEDFCDCVGWDLDDVNDHLLDSEISFGNNDDTLVLPVTLARICRKSLPNDFNHDLMVSLGS